METTKSLLDQFNEIMSTTECQQITDLYGPRTSSMNHGEVVIGVSSLPVIVAMSAIIHQLEAA